MDKASSFNEKLAERFWEELLSIPNHRIEKVFNIRIIPDFPDSYYAKVEELVETILGYFARCPLTLHTSPTRSGRLVTFFPHDSFGIKESMITFDQILDKIEGITRSADE